MLDGLNQLLKGGPPNFRFKDAKLGDIISAGLEILFLLAASLSFIWIAVASLQWLFSAGDKEKVARARMRITMALLGLAIVLLAFVIKNFVQDVLIPQDIPPVKITPVPVSLVTPAYAASADLSKIFGFGDLTSLGQGISRFVVPIFSIAATGVVFYFVIAAFRYLTSGGDKEQLAKAKAMITHALIGFILLMLSFLIIQIFISALFGTSGLRVIGI